MQWCNLPLPKSCGCLFVLIWTCPLPVNGNRVIGGSIYQCPAPEEGNIRAETAKIFYIYITLKVATSTTSTHTHTRAHTNKMVMRVRERRHALVIVTTWLHTARAFVGTIIWWSALYIARVFGGMIRLTCRLIDSRNCFAVSPWNVLIYLQLRCALSADPSTHSPYLPRHPHSLELFKSVQFVRITRLDGVLQGCEGYSVLYSLYIRLAMLYNLFNVLVYKCKKIDGMTFRT